MSRNYCYVTLLTNDTYVRGVVLLNECLRRYESQYPLICMVTDNVGEESLNILKLNNVTYKIIKKIAMPEKLYNYNKELNAKQTEIWKYCLTKFNIFKMTEYDKLIFLDADLLILKNLDHCFKYEHMTAALDGEYVNLWPKWPHFNSGFMVIEPNLDLYNSIMDFANNITDDLEGIKDFKGDKYLLADQEILNLYYKDWPSKENLHLNKYYNIFPIHCPDVLEEDIWKNAYFVHFVGTKPWECFYNTEGLRSKFILDSDSVKTGCLSLYEVAFAIINLVYNNDYKNIDWNEVTSNGELSYQTAVLAKDLFRDFDRAEKYINAALKQNPNNKKFTELKQYIDNSLLAKDLYLSIKTITNKLLDKFSLEGLPTMKLYGYLAAMENGLTTDNSINAILDFWNTIVASFKENNK